VLVSSHIALHIILFYEGTKYNLQTGEVLEWTPEGKNITQKFLNNLKKATPAQPLVVYPTQVSCM